MLFPRSRGRLKDDLQPGPNRDVVLLEIACDDKKQNILDKTTTLYRAHLCGVPFLH